MDQLAPIDIRPIDVRRPVRTEILGTLAMAGPLVVGQLCIMGQNTVDVLLAGHVSAHVLGAVGIGTSLWWLAQMSMAGVLLSVSPAVSQLDGAGRRAATAPVFVQSLWLAALLSVIGMAAVGLGGPWLVAVMGVDQDLRSDIATFLRIVCFATPAMAVFIACRGLSEGLSLPRPSMLMGLAGLMLLLPLGWVLMYGPFGLPRLGVRGSAIANLVVAWAQVLGFGLILRYGRRYGGLGWRGAWTGPRAVALRALLAVGLPTAASMMMESGLFTAAALLIGRFGPQAASSHQLALSVAALSFMVPLGIAFAATVRVGRAAGRGDLRGERRAGTVALVLAVTSQTISCVIMLSIPHTLAALYTQDPDTQARAVTLLRLAGAFQLADGVQVVAIASLRGLKDTRVPMLLTGVSYWLFGLPVGVFCAFLLDMGPPGMWLGLIAGLTAAAVSLLARFLWLTRRRPIWLPM